MKSCLTQPGNPAKLAEAMLTLVNMPNPPQLLALGSDTIERINGKNRLVAAELERWHDLSLAVQLIKFSLQKFPWGREV
ncbi:MAG: hypothetical protein ACRERW_06500 [Pseudomonas sp.]